MPKLERKSVIIQVRTTPAIKNLAVQEAKKQRRSVNNFIETLIVNAATPDQRKS